MMRLSCEQWCPIQEYRVNLRGPNFFSAKVKLSEEENKESFGKQKGWDIQKEKAALGGLFR
jgi:hypothetical protein